MTERMSSFTVQEFIDKLQRDQVAAPLTLTGMVKLPDDPGAGLMFAPGTRCGDWIAVPADAVERIEVLEIVPCGDHTHPLVALTFRAPDSPEGAMFAALLSATVRQRSAGAVQPLHASDATPGRARLVTRRSVANTGAAVLRSGCAAACNEYEVDDAGNIYQLYSCKDYGGGIYICYYN